MVGLGNEVYHPLTHDGAHSQPEARQHWSKSPMMLIVGGSCLFFALVATTITSSSTDHVTSIVGSTNLAGLSPVARVRAGAGLDIRSFRGTVPLSSSSVLRKMSFSRNGDPQTRDVKVRHGSDWDDMPPEVIAKEANKYLASLGKLPEQQEDVVEAFLFDLGEIGNQRFERPYARNEWGKVKDLNPGVTGFQKGFKNMMRQLGKECSAEDLQQASADLSGLSQNDVAAVQRSDGTWRYAKLIERPEPAMFEKLRTQPSPENDASMTPAVA